MMKMTSPVNTTSISTRMPMPSPAEMPAIPDAIPVANGFTVEARQPACVPSTTIMMATTVSSPSARITGTNMRKYTIPSS